MSLASALRKIGADEQSVVDAKHDRARDNAKLTADKVIEAFNTMSDAQQVSWFTARRFHDRFASVDDAERDPDLVFVTHVCTAIEPCERGMMAYMDVWTRKVYTIPYVAR